MSNAYIAGDIVEIRKPPINEIHKCGLAWVAPDMDQYIGKISEIRDVLPGNRYKLVNCGGWMWHESWLISQQIEDFTCGDLEDLL